MTHRSRYLVLPPLDCTMTPPPDNLGQVAPCTRFNKKQSASKRFPCTLCQEESSYRRCSPAGTCCGAGGTNPSWHLQFKAKTVTDTPSLPGTASFFMLCDENTHLYLTVVDIPRSHGAWGTLHPALSIIHCVTFAMAAPAISQLPTPSSPPFTRGGGGWVSFFATYSLGVLMFGLLMTRSSQPHAVVSCGARLFPCKHLAWIIIWRGTTAGSPHGTNNSQGFPMLQHQRTGTRPSLVATIATQRMQCTVRVPVSNCTT